MTGYFLVIFRCFGIRQDVFSIFILSGAVGEEIFCNEYARQLHILQALFTSMSSVVGRF